MFVAVSRSLKANSVGSALEWRGCSAGLRPQHPRRLSRREVLRSPTRLGGCALGFCCLSGCERLPFGPARPSKVARIGFLGTGSTTSARNLEGFREELRNLGYVEGTNVVLEMRFA